MNSRNETIDKIREADHKNLRTLISDSDAIIGQTMDKLEAKHREIKEKILTLQEEKETLLRGPMAKQELLESSLEGFQKGRSEVLSVLKNHLSSSHKGHAEPFDAYFIKKEFSDDRAHRLLYLILQKSDVTNMINEMEEIGLPLEEKNTRISEIDAKINKLMGELKKV